LGSFRESSFPIKNFSSGRRVLIPKTSAAPYNPSRVDHKVYGKEHLEPIYGPAGSAGPKNIRRYNYG